MPELPDVVTYVEALRRNVVGRRVDRLDVRSAFLVRTFEPPISEVERRVVHGVERLGKRLILQFDDDLFLVLHLMIAGRLRWSDDPKDKTPAKIGAATFRFAHGSLHLTEASSKKQASIHLVRGRDGLAAFDRGGLDVLTCELHAFATRLRLGNHTLKRALTDPKVFDGIGNAYSDEILHAAKLSPIMLTSKLDEEAVSRLFDATRTTLDTWIARLRAEFAGRFPGPGDITAFRPGFAVHGKFGQPCPVCGTKVQRIVYGDSETNYCPTCQTGGAVLADRSLSRLLKNDWPRSVEELAD